MAMHGYGMGSCARGDLYEHMAASDAGTTRCRCIWVGLFLFFSLFCVSVGLVFASDSLICWAVDVVKQPRAANKARVGRSLFSVSDRRSCRKGKLLEGGHFNNRVCLVGRAASNYRTVLHAHVFQANRRTRGAPIGFQANVQAPRRRHACSVDRARGRLVATFIGHVAT